MSQRFLLTIHKWFGLIAGLFILIMGLTGSILVFDDEIEHFIHSDVVHHPETDQPVSLDAAYASVDQRYPHADVRITVLPEAADRAIETEVRRPDDRRYLYIHPTTGEILRDLDSYDTFSYWMMKLHYTLHGGFWGEVVMLLAGFIFIASLLSGFWFYRKAIVRVLTFKIRPRFRDLRTGSSELHRSVGVWALVFNLVTAVTGVIILYLIVEFNATAPESSPQPNPPEVTASLDDLTHSVQEEYPGFQPTYISMPRSSEGLITLYGRMEGDLPIYYEFSNYIQYDPATGEEQRSAFIQNQSLSAQLMSVTYPLHFGDWGGIIIKIFYCLFGLAPAILSITGFIIWQKRNKKKRRVVARKQAAAEKAQDTPQEVVKV